MISLKKKMLMAGKKIPKIGEFWEGGYYVGELSISGTKYRIVCSGFLEEMRNKQWKINNTNTSNTGSNIDGLLNTNAMNNSNHPAAFYCKGFNSNGKADWYLPSTGELDLLIQNDSMIPEGQKVQISADIWSSTSSASGRAFLNRPFQGYLSRDYTNSGIARPFRRVRA